MTDDFTVDFEDTPIDEGQAPTEAAVKPSKEERAAKFQAEHKDVIAFIAARAARSSFFASIQQGIYQYGAPTDNQLAAIKKIMAAEVDKAVQVAAVATLPPDYPVLAKSFLTASAALKHPKLHLVTPTGRAVVLSRCGVSSRTPGEINMTDGRPYGSNTYYGRITPEGRVYWRNIPASILDEVKALLAEFEKDPKAAVKVQGQRTGSCCICGKELTNPESVALGIGPICGGRWGI